MTNLGGADSEITGRDRRKWYVLGLLTAVYLLGLVDRSVISVVVEPLKAEFHLSDKQVGMLPTFFALAYGLLVLPMGWLADRMERRVLLSVAVAIWSVLTGVCALSSNFLMLLAARIGVGAGEAPLTPASMSIIADTFPPSQRNTAVGILISGPHIGQIVIFVCGGWLLMHFDWRMVFLVACAPGLLLAGLLYFTVREPKRGIFDEPLVESSPKTPQSSANNSVRDLLANPALCYAILALAVGVGVGVTVVVWATSFMVRIHGLTVGHAAISTGLDFGICAAIGSLLIGPFADRFSMRDPRKLVLIPAFSTLMAFVGGSVMILGPTFPIALAGMSLLALTTGFFTSTGYSLVLSLSTPTQRGVTTGAMKMMSSLIGDVPMPFITGAISDAIGGPGSIRPALLCTLTLMLVSSFLYARVYKIAGNRERGTP